MPQLGEFSVGGTRDLIVVVNESTANECIGEAHQMVFLMDITTEATPQVISNFHVPEASENFCSKGGRFGAHSSNENMTPIYNGRIVFIAYFNAGVRAVDIRNPFKPVEVAYFIPSVDRQHRPSMHRGQRRRPMQDGDPDQQRRGRQPGSDLHRGSGQHGHAHPRADGLGPHDRELPVIA